MGASEARSTSCCSSTHAPHGSTPAYTRTLCASYPGISVYHVQARPPTTPGVARTQLSLLPSGLQLLATPPDFASNVPVFARRRGVLEELLATEGEAQLRSRPTRRGRRVHHTLGPRDGARGGRVYAGMGLSDELACPTVPTHVGELSSPAPESNVVK